MGRTIWRRMQAGAAAAALAALAACGGGGDDRPPAAADDELVGGDYDTFTGAPPGGTLVVLSEGEPDGLNPLTYDSNPAYQIVHLLFRALARRDSTLTGYTPDLLERWEVQPDSSVLLHLRPGVQWHDGTPVTAEDVVFTIERQGDEAVASPRQADVGAVASAEAVDSMTVRVRFERFGPATVNALLEVVPVPKHLLDTVPPERMRFTGFSQRPVGNGLFRFGEWNKGQDITVVANEDAPEGRPALDRVTMRQVPDATARLTELMSGNAGLTKITSEQRQQVESARGVELHAAARVRPAWIAWNVDRFPVNDPAVRRAILMGLDRPAIVQGLLGEDAEAALSPIPPGLGGQGPNVRPIPHDPAAARQLLQQAGWQDTDNDGVLEKGGRPLRVEVEYSSADPVRADVLVAMQAQLREIGVQLVPRAFERTTWVERLRGRDFMGSFWGWGYGPGVMGPNAEMVFHSRSIPPGGPNFAGYSSPRVDALVDRILVEADTTQARALWTQLEQALIDDAVYAPIFLDPEFYAVHQRFGNVKMRGPEWWEDVIYWHVPPNQRIARDRARPGG